MIIKELKIEDISNNEETILGLLINAYESNFMISEEEIYRICKEKIQLLKKYMVNDTAKVLGAIIDDKLVGFLWIYKHEYFNEKRIHVNQISVNKQYRGKGIAKKLFKALESWAKSKNICVIDLFVSEINENALKLYEKIGFKTERRYMKKKL